jgi:hypothetical protein
VKAIASSTALQQAYHPATLISEYCIKAKIWLFEGRQWLRVQYQAVFSKFSCLRGSSAPVATEKTEQVPEPDDSIGKKYTTAG